MASQWYYAVGDNEQGPISSRELKQLADSGQLSPDDQVWREGMADWVAASTIPKLFSDAAAGGAAPQQTGTAPAAGTGGMPAVDTGAAAPEFAVQEPAAASGGFPAGGGAPAGGTTGVGAARRTSSGGNAAQQAAQNALAAVQMIAVNPVGGLEKAYQAIGAKGAMHAGLVFGVAFGLLLVIGPTIKAGFAAEPFFKLLFLGLAYPAGLIGGAAATRGMGGGKEGFESDVFVGTAAALPMAICFFLSALFAETFIKNMGLATCLGVIAIGLSVLMLFSGMHRIARVGDGLASIAAPVTLVIGFVAFYFICFKNLGIPMGRMPF